MPTLRNGIWEFDSVADAAEFAELTGRDWTVQLVPREPRHGAFIRALPDQQARLMRALVESPVPLHSRDIADRIGVHVMAVPVLFRHLKARAQDVGINLEKREILIDGHRLPITHYST